MLQNRFSRPPVASAFICCALLVLAPGLARADDDSASTPPPANTTADNPGLQDAPSANDDDSGIAHPHHAAQSTDAPQPANAAQPTDAAQPTEGTHRIQLFLIPVGEDTGPLIAPAQSALESEVNATPGFEPVDLVEELQPAPTDEILADQSGAQTAILDGNQELGQRQYEEAANRYRHAIELLSAAVGVVKPTDLADATVRLAVALQYSGEDEQAHQAFRSAAIIDLAGKVDGRTIDSDLGVGLDRARRELAQGPVGTLSVVTAPAGSRVFVGGIYRGQTPISIDHLPAGMNFVRVDRPGARRFAQLVEVKEGQDVPLRLKMSFSPETIQLQRMLQAVPEAISREPGYPDMVRALARRFRLRRVVIGLVRHHSEDLGEVRLAVFDAERETRLIDEHMLCHTDPAMMRSEVSKWARGVIDRADGSRNRSATDPLDRSDGTEGWYAHEPPPASPVPAQTPASVDDSSAAPAPPPPPPPPPPQKKKKKEKTKSLDDTSGTEDWDN